MIMKLEVEDDGCGMEENYKFWLDPSVESIPRGSGDWSKLKCLCW